MRISAWRQNRIWSLTFRIGEHQAELKSAYTDRHLQILGPYEYDLYKALILRAP